MSLPSISLKSPKKTKLGTKGREVGLSGTTSMSIKTLTIRQAQEVGRLAGLQPDLRAATLPPLLGLAVHPS